MACERPKQEHKTYTEPPKQTDTLEVKVLPSDTIYYTLERFSKKIADCQSDTANCASFTATFPLVEIRLHSFVADSINYLIRSKLYSPLIGDKPANGINSLLEPYYETYKAAREEANANGQEYIGAWYYNRQFTVIENTRKIFTIAHSEQSYAGGAHPNSFTNWYNFNPSTGRQITLDHIFKPGYNKKLNQLAEKKFRKRKNVPAGTSLEDAGYLFKDNIFYLPNNFRLNDKGILFRYNPYEVASYAEGAIEIQLTWAEISDVISDEFNPEKEEQPAIDRAPVARH